MALDGRVKGDDTSLASSTLLADENNKDIFGLVVSYAVKVVSTKQGCKQGCKPAYTEYSKSSYPR